MSGFSRQIRIYLSDFLKTLDFPTFPVGALLLKDSFSLFFAGMILKTFKIILYFNVLFN